MLPELPGSLATDRTDGAGNSLTVSTSLRATLLP